MTNKSVLLRVSVTNDETDGEQMGVIKLDADEFSKMGFAYGDKDISIISTCHEFGRVLQLTCEAVKQFGLEES